MCATLSALEEVQDTDVKIVRTRKIGKLRLTQNSPQALPLGC